MKPQMFLVKRIPCAPGNGGFSIFIWFSNADNTACVNRGGGQEITLASLAADFVFPDFHLTGNHSRDRLAP